MDADQHEMILVEPPRRGFVERILAHRWCDGVPDVVRGLACLLLTPIGTLKSIGRSWRLRAQRRPDVIVTRAALELRDEREPLRFDAPLRYSVDAIYGGGARVIAALEDGRDVELPLGDLTVAEAEETADRLEEQLRPREGRYR